MSGQEAEPLTRPPFLAKPPSGPYGWHVVGPDGSVWNTYGPGETGHQRAEAEASDLRAAFAEGFAAGQRSLPGLKGAAGGAP